MMTIHRERKKMANGWEFEEQKIVVPTPGTMEYVTDINIIEAVIHVLDNNGEEPILNEYKLELNNDIYKFLFKHIDGAFKDEELKYAIFNPDRNIIKETSQEYLTGLNTNIVEISKELAKQMFYLMKANKNIPSCDLVTVYISTDQGPMLGILKMDYVKNFMHQVDFIDEKIGIGIVEHVAALPNSKLKKSAFIKPIRENQEIDLMVLDKSKGDEDYGSNYFLNNYLGCTIIQNSRDETKVFLTAAEQFLRVIMCDDPEKSFELREFIKNKMIKKDLVKVEEIAKEFFGDDIKEKEKFSEYIQSFGINEVNIDRKYLDKKFKRVRLNLDREVDLYLDLDVYNDNNKFEVVRAGDGTVNIILKNVRSVIEK